MQNKFITKVKLNLKISFSTLACPDLNWEQIIAAAKDFGYGGVELRGIGAELHSAKCKPFLPENINKTILSLAEKGIKIPCISSSACLSNAENADESYTEVIENIALANKLGVKYVRILGDLNPKPTPNFDDTAEANVIAALSKLLPIAAADDVTLLIETNGAYSDTARLKKLVQTIGADNLGVLWDIHHPYRYNGEDAETTLGNIGAYVKFVHVKDSVMVGGEPEYRLCGEGDLPLDKFFAALDGINYDGYVSLEWVKRWFAGLDNAGIVIPHFARYIGNRAAFGKKIYQDDRKTGYYPWKKNTLINETFPDILDRICDEFPNQYAFRYTEEDIDYTRTYPEFRAEVDTFAAALIAMGVKKGEHVSIWATNVPAWFITFWASAKIGAVLVTVNTAYKIHEAEYLLSQSDTHTLVMIEGHKDSHYKAIIEEICPELTSSEKGKLNSIRLPKLKNVITIGFEMHGAYTFDEAVSIGQGADKSAVAARRAEIDVHDVCNMQYTSGTTGFPKGVMLTHYNVVNNGKVIGDCMDLSTHDELMIQVPMFHCFGMVLAMTASVTHGATMSPISSFSPRKGLAAIRIEKERRKAENHPGITAFHGVPTMFIAMLDSSDFAATDFSGMRTGIMAGSPCPENKMREVVEKMNMSDICITYGQTESSPAITMSKTTDSVDVRCATVGAEVYGVE
ncbi:MAG: AMP-binding protein, partial [Oscillospiraceae bacterium]|nr:AMP-binding protein [Oscillospiraceae bacterium]